METQSSTFERSHSPETLNPKTNVIVFMGSEGSGKSTQARKFAEKIGVAYLTYGDIFRETAEKDETYLGEECRRVFKEHDYIDPSVLFELIGKELSKLEYEHGVVLDGVLRTQGELDEFDNLLNSAGIENPEVTVFYLRVPGWKAFERAKDRGRPDDDIEGMLGRLGAFYDGLGWRTSTLEGFNKENRLRFIHVDATKTIDEISEEISGKFAEN